ncbi:MAG: hypothetical protein SFU53_12535 [Terrimicrobiaceae bacterium]|nr:hypothetical protein [Terrimicrobiaceae bacterium]
MDWLTAAHVLTTFAMTGLIWFVQIVHYPMLARFGPESFGDIEREHCDRTGFVVAPLMLVEAATALLLWLSGWREVWFIVSLGLLALIWISTAVLQVPLHRRLLLGRDERALRRLVLTNWVRTVAWTARSACLVVVISAR